MDAVQLTCVACEHAGELDAARFRRLRDEGLNANSLAAYYNDLVCSSCRARRVRIATPAGRVLFDPDDMVFCRGCGHPIALARLELRPGTTVCTICAEDGETPQKSEPWPQPPNKYRRCPACENPTEVRQNTQTGALFLSCKVWACSWTMAYEAS